MVLFGEFSEQARALAATNAGFGNYCLQDRGLVLGTGWVPVQGAIPPISLMRLVHE